jgi:cell division protein FtsB
MEKIDEKRQMASFALLQKLYDNGTKDMYDIIGDFIKYTIYTVPLREFDLATLTQKVNDTFSIKLLDAVVKRAVKKLGLTIEKGIYKCNLDDYKDIQVFENTANETTEISNNIFNKLISFVENKQKGTLTSLDRELLMQDFNMFMFDKREKSNFVELIAQFIVECGKDPELVQQLTNIKEGVVLYGSINYNEKTKNASKKWSDYITVFLDTEILFHMAGYNGDTYKQLFDDFFKLVDEVNADSQSKSGPKIIKLCYFDHTKNEYDRFFQIAEEIVKGQRPLISSVTAMRAIVNGCHTPSDIAYKKLEFEKLLQTHGITFDGEKAEGYYSAPDWSLNIESDDMIDKFEKALQKVPRQDIANSLISLSHIYVLRKGKLDKHFEKSRYILLTDNYVTRYIAWDDSVKQLSGNVLCTDLYYFTDRLWCRLGKSFGLNKSPKAYDVISKAQIILSSHINKHLTESYEIILRKYRSKEITQDQMVDLMAQFKTRVMSPEDIQAESNVDAAIAAISSHNIDAYIQENIRKTNDNQKVLAQYEDLKRKLAEAQKTQNAERERADNLEADKLANVQWEHEIEAYKEERSKKVHGFVKTECKFFELQIFLLILFIGVSYLVSQPYSDDLDWYWKVSIYVGSMFISQIVAIIRPLLYPAESIKKEYRYLLKRKTYAVRREFSEELKKVIKRPSWQKIFLSKLKAIKASKH